ncbi:T9SS-dependent choice-of-anchor J family protein [Hymenobacter sp. BT491]|uniref:T9SS-dependent choice-of-anchor J family protein n=1 Tax=Hymenobacter sp. BT491 TaxID=2766779 RepID=UPI0016535717|nr:choice-of-anchor J domain-containing protein [Hymenobacter sp. BT491]MBC6989720.1 choice-of-anchor J domain-containing protein [Hymenobacter sp. BT491]
MQNHLRFLRFLTGVVILLLVASGAFAQVTLSTSPYSENFDGVGGGLPAGFTVRTGATATVLGTAATPIIAPTVWNSTSSGFKNVASATGLTAASTTDEQNAATNRALAVRQTGTFGDPGAAFVFQLANTTRKSGFKLTFQLQSLDATSPRTTTWRVDYGIGATPASFTTVTTTPANPTTGGTSFSSTAVTADFGSQLDNVTEPVWIRVVALAASTGSGNRPTSALDDFSLAWSDIAANTPTLAVTPTSLSFGNQNISTESAIQSYSLTATDLTDDVTVTAPAGFAVSKSTSAGFAATLAFTKAELATAQTVYVRFAPTAGGPASGSVTNASPGAQSKSVAVSGTGIDPNNLVFSFDNCATTVSDGWTQFSLTGDQTWACTTFGHDAADATGKASKPNGVQINGFANGTNVTNEDWFISPAFNTASFTFPLLSFWSRVAFNGAPLRLRVSTDYSGSGNPNAAGVTWTDLDAFFPAIGTDTWTLSTVDLSAYKAATVYVAFVYNATTEEGARWTLDDVSLRNSTTAPPPSVATTASSLDFGYQPQNTAATQTFTVTFRNLRGPGTITASGTGFQISKNGTTFDDVLTYTADEANGVPQTVTVRFSPTQAQQNYSGSLTLASLEATSVTVALSGNTFNPDNTLEVVNWNLEWFGSPQNGPTNDDQQQANVRTVLNSLQADIYGLVEVVDTVRLGSIVRQLPGGGYTYKVSDFGSFADNAQDADYASAQKLAFVYKTSIFKNVTISSLFRCTQAENCPEYNYWSSGRFPYLMDADVTLNGITKHFTFVLIHAKANTSPTATSYDRRKNAADGLKAKLDADYANSNVVILGDFNDDLDVTITTGLTTTITSYSAFTTDPANYTALTLPLSQAGLRSTVSYNDIIDHVVVTNDVVPFYLPNSATILTGVANLVPNYGNTTTDHYPVQTRYTFGTALAAHGAKLLNDRLELYPNPATTTLRLRVPETGKSLKLQVNAVDGRAVLTGTGSLEQLNQQLSQRVSGLSPGVYIIRLAGPQQTYVKRFVKQ